ncbi:unnamed protein product, partial [Brassica rapa subsp. narinosa]
RSILECKKERKRVGGKHRRPAARMRACRRRWLHSCRSLLGFPLCASICCPIRYIFGSGIGFYRRKRFVYGGFQTAVISLSLDSCFRGVEASSALRRRQSLREVEAPSALRRRIMHRGVKALVFFFLGSLWLFMALVMVETRVCSLVGGREKRPYQVGEV